MEENGLVIDLRQHPNVLARIFSYFDPLELYKTYYISMSEVFNNDSFLSVLSSVYDINKSFNKFIELLYEFDLQYKTSMICCLSSSSRALKSLISGDMYLTRIYINRMIKSNNFSGDNIDSIIEELYYTIGTLQTGEKYELIDKAIDNIRCLEFWLSSAESIDSFKELESYSNNKSSCPGSQIAIRSLMIKRLVSKLKINELSYFFSGEITDLDYQSMIHGAILRKDPRLIKMLLTSSLTQLVDNLMDYVTFYSADNPTNDLSKINMVDTNPIINWSNFYMLLGHSSLEVIKELENIICINYYEVAISCCDYYGDYDVFIYCYERIKIMSKILLTDISVRSERTDILKYILVKTSPSYDMLMDIMKKALTEGQYCSASLLWSQDIIAKDSRTLDDLIYHVISSKEIDDNIIYWISCRTGINEEELSNMIIIADRKNQLNNLKSVFKTIDKDNFDSIIDNVQNVITTNKDSSNVDNTTNQIISKTRDLITNLVYNKNDDESDNEDDNKDSNKDNNKVNNKGKIFSGDKQNINSIIESIGLNPKQNSQIKKSLTPLVQKLMDNMKSEEDSSDSFSTSSTIEYNDSDSDSSESENIDAESENIDVASDSSNSEEQESSKCAQQ